MLPDFNVKPTPNLCFGPGKLSRLAMLLKHFGSRLLIVIGGHSFISGSHWPGLRCDLLDHGFTFDLVHITGEPSPRDIDTICEKFSPGTIDAVIAIGGGSVLDAGKAVSAMLVENRPVAYFLEGIGIATPTGRKVPFVAVPTTSGTGSEATNNAVISSIGEIGFKKSLRHDNYIPDIALIDPTLTASCPRALTVACGMDTFTQLVEAYLSTSSSPFTDTLSLAGIQCVLRSLETTCNDGRDLAARTDMAYASYLSGIVLANAGLGTIHGFASAIGGFFTIPHGVVCGTLMAESNRAALMRLRHTGENPAALGKYANLGRMVGSEPIPDEQAQDLFITYLDALTEKLGVARLGTYGIGEDDLDKIVAHSANKDNPARFNESELHEILQARLAF